MLLVYALYSYQPHIELEFYNRDWVYREIHTLTPLSGCFDAKRTSPSYNVSEYVYGAKQTEVQSGMALKTGLDCYDLAGTIQSRKTYPTGYITPDQRTQYHTYWRADLAPFGPRQDWMLKSFFATQNTQHSRLILWSNGDLSPNKFIQNYLHTYPDSFILRVVDKAQLARGTLLEKSVHLQAEDSKAWVDGDLVRLLVLWAYGGVWVDMDTLLTRDLDPLLEHEFVTQWDCYGQS